MLYFFLSCFSLKSHVTDLSSLFDTFHIKINEDNCEGIRRHLVIAMAGKHAPKKLRLEFRDQLTPVKRQMLLDYMEVISFLAISVYDEDKEFLLQQSTLFESLGGLKLTFDSFLQNNRAVCEALLVKHALNLKNLEVYGLDGNLSVPVLPVIDSLVLALVGKEAAQSLYEQSRNTITSFTYLGGYDIQLSNSAAYKGECLFPFYR